MSAHYVAVSDSWAVIEGVNELESSVIPLLASPPRSASAIARSLKERRGGCVIKKNFAKPRKQTQPGWFSFRAQSENHPGLAVRGGFAKFAWSLGHPSFS